MNQEWVTVSAVEATGVWVESMQRSACDSCNAKSGCGQRTLSQLGKPIRLWIETIEPLHVGSQVQVSLPVGGLALSAMVLYGLPLLGLILTALIAQAYDSEQLALALAVPSLLIGLWFSRKLSDKLNHLWQPTLVPSTINLVCIDK